MKPSTVDLSVHNKVVKAFKDESDRGAAVLAGSLVDDYLVKFMKSNMVAYDKIDELFDALGPFSTFSSRYKTA